jgi:hypothetical protein
MTRRALPAAALLALALLIAPEPTRADHLTGWASAYAPGVMDDVVRLRFRDDMWRHTPPYDWYTAAGAIATNNCRDVGRMATLIDPAGREWRVLVADCGGDDGGAEFMTRNNIAAELDWNLWQRLVNRHGRPLKISLK